MLLECNGTVASALSTYKWQLACVMPQYTLWRALLPRHRRRTIHLHYTQMLNGFLPLRSCGTGQFENCGLPGLAIVMAA